MLFKAKKKVNVKQPDGLFASLHKGDEIELPEKYLIHPDLEVVEAKKVVKKAATKKAVKKKAAKK